MIRRDAGNDWLLISQADHAALSAQLAQAFGNSGFDKPSATDAIALHDAGWLLHDNSPTINNQGFPLDVFETPRSIALPIWAASADRASEVNPYAGLLVSLHSLSLSIHSTSNSKPEDFELKTLQDQFEVNKFQHREVERQELLRRQLGFRTDVHLKHGLADAHASERDDQLRFDFRILQAMDLISLCLCCTKLPVEQTNEILRAPTGGTARLSFMRDSENKLRISPWPFAVGGIELGVLCRRVAKMRFKSNDAFQEIYRQSPAESVKLIVTKR